jgi:hypothetical protein
MPAQPLLAGGACGDQIFAMVDQQANVERRAVQVRAGEVLDPSFSARATLNASIESDLPRSRDERRAPAMCFGATRTIRSPRAIRNRSNAPDTCRQSSIAHTRAASGDRGRVDGRLVAQLAGGLGGQRAADHGYAAGLPGLAGCVEREGLAGPGRRSHHPRRARRRLPARAHQIEDLRTSPREALDNPTRSGQPHSQRGAGVRRPRTTATDHHG